MSTQHRREIQFRGASILDAELARPIGGAAPPAKRANPAPLEGPLDPPGSCPECGAAGSRAHASWCETARAERDPAMVSRSEEVERASDEHEKTAAREVRQRAAGGPPKGQAAGQNGGAKSARPHKIPTRAGSSAVSPFPAEDAPTGAGPGTREPARQAYLEAVAALAGARLALIEAEGELTQRQEVLAAAAVGLAKAVDRLGADPLDALVKRRRRGGALAVRRRGQPLEEILPLLPGRCAEIAEAHGGMSIEHIRGTLARAEKQGLVRREDTGEVNLAGWRVHVWHRVEDTGGPPS